ncbi:branched-chain amino acid transaminase, partial [Patescibacteria group bacterium]|nr:branched-chain amino acid transaminase [Patescibacteria group bacterium]
IFEGIRFYSTPDGPAIFRLQDHIKRFFYSATPINLKMPYTQKELCDVIVKLLKKNNVKNGYIRPLGYYGYGKMGLCPLGAPVNVAILALSFSSYLGGQAIKVKTSKYMRLHPDSTIVDAKVTGHYANSIIASLEIHKAGFDEALFLDYKGNVAEGPGENIFIVKNGILYTPPSDNILPGFTRDAIMALARDNGYKVIEKNLKLKDIYSADEAFLSGTAAEITAIGSLDNKKIGDEKMGPITAELKKEYLKIVKGKNPKYKKWLTYVN